MSKFTVTPSKRLANLRSRFAEQIKTERKNIDKFTADLKNEATNAFEWGKGAMVSAARIKAAQCVIRIIDNLPKEEYNPTERLFKLHAIMTDDVVRRAAHVPSCSSQISNVMTIELTGALADAVRKIGYTVSAANAAASEEVKS